MKAFLIVLGLLLLISPLPAADTVEYQRDVKPLLTKYCYECHGPDKQRSGLRVDTAAALVLGGNSGPALVAGKSAESRLIQAVSGAEGVKVMPPKEPRLNGSDIAKLRAWIDAGALAPTGEVAAQPAKNRDHWAFRAPVRLPEPSVHDRAWIRNPVDAFILARLEREGIAPALEADRPTLIRRLSLDLLGLPPTNEDVEAFLADTRPDAYEQLVDRFLQSPHYGERWARLWLDAARYADSNGFNIDAPRSMWPYRDWVINAFNRDLPFDRFTIEQLAGDLLPNATVDQKIATGLHRNTLINQEGGIDKEQFRVESVVDRVNTTGAVFLGLTVGCSQCHDHKYDPISQKEYYQLFAFFNNQDEPNLDLATPQQQQLRKQTRARIADLDKKLKVLDTTSEAKELVWEKKLTPEQKELFPARVRTVLNLPDNGRSVKQQEMLNEAFRELDQVRHVLGGLAAPANLLVAAHLEALTARRTWATQIARLKKVDPDIVSTMVMQERKAPRDTFVHLGGDFLRKGAPVWPGVPAVFPRLETGAQAPTRLDFAQWVVDPRNPLTARVIVNRFWQHYFGKGLVETENDFGTQGIPPTHPELLDWLATEFVARGWSMKAMHRLLVTSATYRQSSHARLELALKDPNNRLLARQSRLRLDAEIVRDVALAASGLLSPKIGGPSVFPPQPDGVYRFTQIQRDWKPSPGPDRYRRGMYTYFWRSAPHPGLTVFDAPDSTTACTRRNRSNTPLQALTLLNDQAFYEFAQALAGRVQREGQPSDSQRIEYAFRLCLARSPREIEEQRLLREAASGKDGWVTIARVLLNLDEFITRE